MFEKQLDVKSVSDKSIYPLSDFFIIRMSLNWHDCRALGNCEPQTLTELLIAYLRVYMTRE